MVGRASKDPRAWRGRARERKDVARAARRANPNASDWLFDRLVGGPRPPYRAQDFVHPELVGASLSEVLQRVEAELFDPTTGAGIFVFYNVGPLERFGKLDVVAFGRSQEEADAAVGERLPRLLGLGS